MVAMDIMVVMAMIIIVVMLVMFIMVIRTDRKTRTNGQTRQTELTFKLDFPGNLCRAAFAILAMFLVIYTTPQHQRFFQNSTMNRCWQIRAQPITANQRVDEVVKCLLQRLVFIDMETAIFILLRCISSFNAHMAAQIKICRGRSLIPPLPFTGYSVREIENLLSVSHQTIPGCFLLDPGPIIALPCTQSVPAFVET